jgi:nucleoside-diphosphate-sugar epimerase
MRDLCRALCARLGRREPWMTMPTSAAKALGAAMEAAWRAAGAKSPPLITKMGAGLMCYDNDVSVERAKRELGYRPQDLFEQRLDDYLRSNRAGE